MGHVYATLDQFKQYLVDVAADFGTASDADLLSALESASRTVDAHCQRTYPDHPTSGFGPRLGTNRYDGVIGCELDLGDDLLTVTTVTGGGGTVTDGTDFYKGPYDRAPYRSLITPTSTLTTTWWTLTRRAVSVVGKWGYQDVTVLSTQLNGALAAVTTTTTVTTDAALVPGMTLLIGSEQLYVRSISGLTASCDRAANGTTAAVQGDDSPVSYYQYPANVTRATLAIAQRRRKARDAGLDGAFGGAMGMPGTMNPERTERWILDDYLSEYKFALGA